MTSQEAGRYGTWRSRDEQRTQVKDLCPARFYWLFGTRLIVLASHADTAGRYDLVENVLPPGAHIPPHRHTRYSEHLYVVAGELTAWVGERKVVLRHGENVFIPVGTPHSLAATGELSDGRFHGFRLDGGSYTILNGTGAFGINNAGQIVGTLDQQVSFLLTGDIYITIDVPGSISTEADGINDLGQIVGRNEDASGNEHGFLATPVPEPSTLLLIGVGSLGLLGWKWHRRQAA